MAFSPLPTNLIAGWSEDGTNVTFPLASVPELTAAEADAATGDSRKIVYALLERFAAWYSALPTADKPGRLVINRGNAFESSPGLFTRTFSFQFILDSTDPLDVADEPA